ncbi:hypothetical protein HYC85_019119 [Camellia sinensis]|uniref:Uncharacterized protein n=1 Tax=Camellia sinensis TaxID=4442 RepID=A0A7J7GLV1_CAMSI|nr:hypothetical protein HYC85_019119 [Camellia sinensis]
MDDEPPESIRGLLIANLTGGSPHPKICDDINSRGIDSTLDEGTAIEMLEALKKGKLKILGCGHELGDMREREREGDVNLDFDFLDSTLDEGAMLDALKEGIGKKKEGIDSRIKSRELAIGGTNRFASRSTKMAHLMALME